MGTGAAGSRRAAPLRVVSVAGTRPEAIKFAPLVRAFAARGDIAHVLVATGQHPKLFPEALAEFGLAADVDLALPNAGPDAHAAALAEALPPLLARLAPDLLLVQGDTTSAWAAAHAAKACGIAVGHVEAGLRSGDPLNPWPEERNRREIDALADLLFAPSAAALANLAGLPGRPVLTGNTGIDALLWLRGRAAARPGPTDHRLVLVTCHRRESIARLDDVAAALLALARREDVRLRLPLHPNPALAPLERALAGHPRIFVEPALGYADLVGLLAAADLLLTDSGGLQEEAPALGLPALVLRETSERPEVIASGNARLVGLDPARIVAEAARLLDDPAARAAMARPAFPYGRGDAAERTVAAILAWAETRAALPSAAALP